MDTRYSDLSRRTTHRVHNVKNVKSIAGTVKLLACLGIFLISFLAKLIFPGVSLQMKNEILPVIENSVDYKAAFSSMGKFFSGDAKFTDAFTGMVAFLISGEEAVKAGPTGDGSSKVAELPLLDESVVGSNKLREDYNLLAELKNGSAQESAAIVNEPVSEQAEQAVKPEEEDVVASFLKSQSLFSGYNIPEDVNIEKVALPFEFIKPVDGIKSSGFGYRLHPVDDVTKFHYGIDYDAAEGTDILSFADGQILVSGESEILGYYLIVSHGDGFITQYFHCKKLSVLSSDEVTKGEKIAEVGQTGNATGPCLHFEILYNGQYLNPEYYLNNEG